MSETLTVVAILAILAAVAIPSVASIRRQLEMARLDEYARQVFLTAQNELTGLKASGRLLSLAGDLKDQGTALEAAPQDYPEEGEGWKDLYILASDTETAETYLLRAGTAVETAMGESGCFLLELDPASGDLYGAFYAEKPFTYEDVEALPGRTREDRAEARLGYYGGSAGRRAEAAPMTFSPEIEVVNGEELYLRITCGDLLLLRRTQEALLLTVTVEDAHGSRWETRFRGGSGMFVNSDSVTVPLVLDSLDPERSFAAVTGGMLKPGDDLSITAVMTYAYHGVNITGAASAETNSLFGGWDADGRLTVYRLRHLNNLRSSLYRSYAGRGGVRIEQTGPISFRLEDWEADSFLADWTKNPLSAFAPIDHGSLFSNGTVYNGNENPITGLVITGGANTGLFASVTGCKLENVRLTDVRVRGGNAVGALAGRIADTDVANCGVYLTSQDAYGRFLEDMPQRLERYTVTGGSFVGGLVGQTAGSCALTNSFAAVPVTGVSYVGGLAGSHETGAVAHCYGSGQVTATSPATGYAGGLLGFVSTADIRNCYATSDVTAAAWGGGLVGSARYGTVRESRAYGKTLKASGAADTTSSGGLAGSGGAVFSGCAYLTQASYNDAFAAKSVSGVEAAGYATLKRGAANAVENSYPYDVLLVGNAFPFPAVGTDSPLPHYGSWPAELQLQTSLVYYERYGDGSYGYYAKTSLVVAGSDGGTGENANRWVVDTLQDRSCVEDGYALLTIYSLTSFICSRNNGAEQTVPVTAAAGRDSALLLQQNVALTFVNQDLDDTSYTISNAKAYRLPFNLQTTGHSSTSNKFYDRLTVRGNTAGGEVFRDYTFYYCADFAKNAVNPDVSKKESDYPADPSAKEPVYVRSARQLNLLGRTTYYWSEGNSSYHFYFLQETDVDFGRYMKTYCGVTYDMMDTSEGNIYRNMPIGQTGESNVKQFRAVYDGGGKKIIDYRCVTYRGDKRQFTGLFGEIYQATLRNIVMVASDPENRSAYVESRFVEGINSGSYTPGVGTLVGLVYVDKNEADSTYASIENCAVSGYSVSYTGQTGTNYAVGGLAGFNFGRIENCSAVMKEVSALSGSGSKHAGGLVGSLNGRGSVSRSYAGGELKGNRGDIGGISGGFENIYGFGSQSGFGARAMRIADSYSYCAFSSDNPSGGAVWGISPTGGTLTLSGCRYLAAAGGSVTVQGAPGASAASTTELSGLSYAGTGRASSANTHPWSQTLLGRTYDFPAVVRNAEEAFVHYGDWPTAAVGGVLDLTEPSYLVYYERYGDGYGYATVSSWGKTISSLRGEDAILEWGYGVLSRENNSSKLTVDGAQIQVQGGPVKESSSDGTEYKLFTVKNPNDMRPDRRGAKSRTAKLNGNSYEVNIYFAADIVLSGREVCGGSRDNPIQIRTADQLQNISTYTENYGGWYFAQTHDIEATAATGHIAAGAYHYDGKGHAVSGLTKTLFFENVKEIQNLRLTDVNITEQGDTAALIGVAHDELENCSVTGGTVTSTGGSAAGLVRMTYNSAEITGCYVSGITITAAQNAAGLVLENQAEVEQSYVDGSIVSTAVVSSPWDTTGAAGLIYLNNGGDGVEDCYVMGTVAAQNASAAGFMMVCNGGSVRNCCAAAQVSGTRAFGFAWNSWMPDAYQSCYTTQDLSNLHSGGYQVGTRVRAIDWSGAVDAAGVPTDDWAKKLKITW